MVASDEIDEDEGGSVLFVESFCFIFSACANDLAFNGTVSPVVGLGRLQNGPMCPTFPHRKHIVVLCLFLCRSSITSGVL